MWEDCQGCNQLVYGKDIEPYRICNHCGYHFRLSVDERLEVTADEGTFEEWDGDVAPVDPLSFPDYAEKVETAQEKTGRPEGMITGEARIHDIAVAIGLMDLAFFGGSMGFVVGDKVASMLERAAERRLPAVVFCASGGARMQESLVSLMQMAKTSGASGKLREAGVPYITVLLDPTYGGVTASFASLGDIVLSEPGTRMGFAGPRVIEITKQRIPPGVQTARFQYEHGMIDAVVPRSELRDTLASILRWGSGGAVPTGDVGDTNEA
jgi:acetyl-CoA carboxylase carboxyl transferase subunit beta